jgi:uncharacterized membrane protein SpoIIM required for sporulation
MSADAGLLAWLSSRIDTWRALEPQLDRLELSRDLSAQEALSAIELYRALGRDLSIARRILPGSRVTRVLDARYAKLHAIIHRVPGNWRVRLVALFRQDVPTVMHELWPTLQWVAMLFVFCTAAGWWLVSAFPELIGLLASEEMINGVERGHLWTSDILNVAPSSMVSLGILTNNIVVSLVAFMMGAFFGLGTFYIIGLNGLMLGGIFAFTHQHGMSDELFTFVIAHGPVELSVICIAGAAGVMLGESIIRPTHGDRRESFQAAAARASGVLVMCALLLIGCGFIEGYLSTDRQLPLASRVVVGLGYAVVMVAALTGRLFRGGPRVLAPATP